MHGGKDEYLDKHELLFCEFESRVGDILRYPANPIVPRSYRNNYPTEISESLFNHEIMKEVSQSFYVRIIFSIFIMLSENRFFLKGTDNSAKLDERLNNISILVLTITPIVRKKWYWVHADDSGEISMINRGIVRIPEQNDAFFFSLSRLWGIFVPNTEHSNKILKEQKENYKPSEIMPISGLGEILGYKINRIMFDNPEEIELFYPGARKLAFHPDVDILPLSKEELP